ncbi:MAG: hypothetical protein IJY05_01755 [Clostridia bacterium]|nr:hypothetical protein [Clostridia bacterium]
MYKAKQRIKTLLLACFAALVSILLTLTLWVTPTHNHHASAEAAVTLTFDDAAKRTAFSTSQQVWEENGITVTNNKTASATNIADYAKPARFYKNSELIIAYPANITKIEFYCNTAHYATALKNSLNASNVNGNIVTIIPTNPAQSFTIILSGGQVRVDSIKVYAQARANIDSASITIGKDITMNYYVTMPDELAEAKMYFTIEENTYEVRGLKGADERYVFSLEVPPHYMASNIKAELKLDEQVLATKAEYSVKIYAQNQLKKLVDEPNDKLKKLLTDLLYYGDAAYNYSNQTTDETPTTNGVENIGTASTSTPNTTDFKLTNMLEEHAIYPAYFKSAGVYFDNVNKIYVKINTANVTTQNLTITVNGLNVNIIDDTVYTDGIFATGFADTYTFVLSCDGVEMQTLTYSVNAYVYAMKDKGNAMSKLAIALYNYGLSAKAYIA